jgi:two-component system LytT family response regulator
MKAVIVEDEQVAAQNLQRMLATVSPDVEVTAVLQSVDESVEWFSLNQAPELIFMDIHLADGSSFAIFEKINIACPIIFTTAYDEYALKAFEVNSIDYLLKPINFKNLERAMTKFHNLKPIDKNIESEAVAKLLASFRIGSETYKSNFLIPHKDKLIPLATEKIACFYTGNKNVNILTLDNKAFVLDATLDDLYAQLDPARFFRANRQYIVAHKAIEDISIWFGNKISVNLVVTAPERIIVSKARVSDFKTWYTK